VRTKPHTYPKKRYFFFLLILSLAICACGGDKDEATQAPARQDAQTSGEPSGAQPTASPAPSVSGGEETVQQPPVSGGEEEMQRPSVEGAANLNDLDSYRMRLTTRMLSADGSWGPDETMEMTWVRETQANHTIMYDASGNPGMEMISIGDDVWMKMGDAWTHIGQEAPATNTSVDLDSMLQDIQSGMTLLGEETVNDVHCKHYSVDADLTIDMPDATGATGEVTAHIEGEMWLADQGGLPAVVIRSRAETSMALFAGNSMTMYEERDVYDINAPISIEPPAEASAMLDLPGQSEGQPAAPENQPLAPPAEPSGAPLEVADLKGLNSYRLAMTYRSQPAQEMATEIVFTEEWVREPPARRFSVSYGADMPTMEYIIVGGSAWMNVGGTWMMTAETDVQDANDNMAEFLAPDPNMIPVGEETVNGVHCQHYTLDVELDFETVHHEMWVADQDGLPPVIIRSVYQVTVKMGETTLVNGGELNVTDINTPITIEPPQ
jgi:hypothetical protein